MSRASVTRRGSAVRIPGTSFHSTTRRAPSARERSVAVRSDPPRPSVVTLPSGARPMKPGTTAIVPAFGSPCKRRRTRRAVAARLGAALPWCPSVATISAASTYAARRCARVSAAATIDAAMRSPRETSRSLARGARCPSTPIAMHSSRYSRAAPSIVASSRRRAGPAGMSARATSRCRRRKTAAARAAAAPLPDVAAAAPSSRRSVTPPSADATITSGPLCRAMRSTARSMAETSASDAPPNFQTSNARFCLIATVSCPPPMLMMKMMLMMPMPRRDRSPVARRRSRWAAPPADSHDAASPPEGCRCGTQS